MRLTIEIPEQMYQNAKDDMLFGSEIIVNAIKNGIPTVKAIPIERLEQIRTEVLAMSFSYDAEDINNIFDKAIKEQNE